MAVPAPPLKYFVFWSKNMAPIITRELNHKKRLHYQKQIYGCFTSNLFLDHQVPSPYPPPYFKEKNLFYASCRGSLPVGLYLYGILSQRGSFSLYLTNLTCVRGVTHSISPRRWEGDVFDARPKPRDS